MKLSGLYPYFFIIKYNKMHKIYINNLIRGADMRYIRAFIMGIFIGALMMLSLILSMDWRSRKQLIRLSRKAGCRMSKRCQCIKKMIM